MRLREGALGLRKGEMGSFWPSWHTIGTLTWRTERACSEGTEERGLRDLGWGRCSSEDGTGATGPARPDARRPPNFLVRPMLLIRCSALTGPRWRIRRGGRSLNPILNPTFDLFSGPSSDHQRAGPTMNGNRRQSHKTPPARTENCSWSYPRDRVRSSNDHWQEVDG